MTVYFANKEPIDINAIAVMGVSVKTGKNPIGFFGTGLKFSIATLLRSGCGIELVRDGESIRFTSQEETIRGETFDRVMMSDEKLGFTTMLGRNWEPWQAYRELYCNAKDEDGVIASELPEGDFGTIFKVTGEAIEKAHRERDRIFLSTAPLFSTETASIHPGHTHHGYYRGVRAHKIQQHCLYTYNVLGALELTEDRTIKHSFIFDSRVASLIPKIEDEGMLERILLAEAGTFEHQLSYSQDVTPSLAFMDVCFRLRTNTKANFSAIRLWEKHADRRVVYSETSLDTFEEKMIDKAMVLLRRLSCPIERKDFMVVDSLGESIFGAVVQSQIMIAKRTFDMGHRFLASTLYEEWIHRDLQLEDKSRDLQNLLFEKLFGMVERLTEMESAR